MQVPLDVGIFKKKAGEIEHCCGAHVTAILFISLLK
jgi:hypothetical protein